MKNFSKSVFALAVLHSFLSATVLPAAPPEILTPKSAGLFNTGLETATVTANWADLKLIGPQRVREVWRQKDAGTFSDKYEASVPPHGVVLVRIFSST